MINILYNYEFINSLSSKYETDYLNKILYIHVKRLFYEFKKKSESDLTSEELKAVTLFSLMFKEFSFIVFVIEIKSHSNISFLPKR